MRKTFRERLELLLAVVNELVEGASLLARKVGQGNDTLLVCQRRHAQRERFHDNLRQEIDRRIYDTRPKLREAVCPPLSVAGRQRGSRV